MTTINHAGIALQTDHATIRKALEEIATEWAALGIDTPVINEFSEIDDDAMDELRERL